MESNSYLQCAATLQVHLFIFSEFVIRVIPHCASFDLDYCGSCSHHRVGSLSSWLVPLSSEDFDVDSQPLGRVLVLSYFPRDRLIYG